jgi:ubiquinone/menaquinone biosynthesis C-methylase UbiE
MEIGSGGGHLMRMFKATKLTAVDVSEVFLEAAKRNLAGYDCEFHKGQIEKLALPVESFNRIICTDVPEHTTEAEVVLAEIQRLLAPDGGAVTTIPVDPLIDGLKKVIRVTPARWVLRVNCGGDHYHFHKWWPWLFARMLERWFVVDARGAAPLSWLPVRACFRCRPR